MQAVIPDAVDLKIKKLGEDTYDFLYVEGFPEGSEEMVSATFGAASALGEMGGLSAFQPSPLCIGFKGQCSMATCANVMVGEFMMWSTIGSATLRDLLCGAVAGAATRGRAQFAKEVGETLDKFPKIDEGPKP